VPRAGSVRIVVYSSILTSFEGLSHITYLNLGLVISSNRFEMQEPNFGDHIIIWLGRIWNEVDLPIQQARRGSKVTQSQITSENRVTVDSRNVNPGSAMSDLATVGLEQIYSTYATGYTVPNVQWKMYITTNT
jgi:hypothetical protein